jgi:hypothetical protein
MGGVESPKAEMPGNSVTWPLSRFSVAIVHRSGATQRFMSGHQMPQLPQPPHSPDLAPSDFYRVFDIDPDSRELIGRSQKQIAWFVVFTHGLLRRPHGMAAIAVLIPARRSVRSPQKTLQEMPPPPYNGHQWYQNLALQPPVSVHRSHIIINPDDEADAPFF